MSPLQTRGRRLPALFVAIALTLSTCGLLTLSPPSAAAATSDITSGSFIWGFKESWRKYIADGSQAGDGATVTAWVPNGSQASYPEAFSFPIASGAYDSETRTTTLDLDGFVHFQSWFGQVTPGQYALDTKFSDLTVTIGPTKQEIRGTHTGYSRSDPGGELHVDHDVVLATMDVTSATTVFGPPTTTWTDLPTVAGPGFSIYGAGTTLDAASITYPGPGGIPELGETFDHPGAPVLKKEGTWLGKSSATAVSGPAARSLEVSGDGDLVYAFEASEATDHDMTVTALDAKTLEPVGTTYSHDIGYYNNGNDRRRMRTTIDPATDTLFFVSAEEGESKLETRIYGLEFDRETATFSASVVGRLTDSRLAGQNPYGLALSNLTWNADDHELAIIESDNETAELQRLVRSGDGWTAVAHELEPSPTGALEGLQFPRYMFVGGLGTTESLLAAGSGSYVVATGESNYYVQTGEEDYQERALPALHLRVAGDDLAVTGIAGTVPRPVFAYNYGYTDAAAGPDGSVLLHGAGQSLDDYLAITFDNGQPTAGEPVAGPDIIPPYGYSLLASSLAYDAVGGLQWATDPVDADGQMIKVMAGGEVAAAYALPEFAASGFGPAELKLGTDGALFVPIKDADTGRYGYLRWANQGLSPKVTTQPTDVSVDLADDEPERDVTLTAAIDEQIGGELQWQAKRVGESRFSDIAEATGATLALAASPTTDGSTYRLKVSNEAGVVVSDEAALTVTYGPRFVVQPKSVTTRPGTIANFNAEIISNRGTTETVWQRKASGYWVDIPASDDNFTVAGSALTVRETDVDQTGSQFRLKAVNTTDAGTSTAYSAAAKLTVKAPEAEHGTITGATLRWTGSEEMQKAPPFGGSSYFSAGVSDGKEGSYRATEGNASVVHLDGTESSPASWATRAAHVDDDPQTDQAVVLADGSGERGADGSARITWDAAWTVNFYGGLLPFTVTDPVLTVDADGEGTLTGDLSGYASSQENPNEQTPVATVEDVVISTFDDVTVDSDGFTIAPDYAGVEVDVPAGTTPQQRTGDWGAWPQGFVDFHLVTGLSSYWYTSGGAADPYKAPADIVIGGFSVTGEPVAVAPAIEIQPSSVRSTVRKPAQFSVTATGTDLAYLWQRKIGSSWVDLSDERGAALSIDRTAAADNGAQFRVKVSNSAGSVTSAVASLRVVPATTSARIAWSGRKQAYRAPARKRIVLAVRVTSNNAVTPTGRVRFYAGSRRIATVTLSSGQARMRLPRSLAVGAHRIKAVYTPGSTRNFTSSTTRTIKVRVR